MKKADAKLTAGAALRDISPPPGVSLAGYPHHPRPNRGVHDPLYAACLYLTDGAVRLAVVTLDVISFSKKNVRCLRERIFRATGIPEKHVMVCASHSHSAPRCSANMTMDALENNAGFDEQYVAHVLNSALEAVQEAVAHPFAARMGVEKGFCGREQGVGGNRRDPLGMADPEVWTIGVRDMDDKLRAVLVKYALHPTFLHSDNFLVSADYPGYVRRHIASLAPEAVFLFAQGTSGNQSPRYFRSGKTFDEAERVGTAIGRAAEQVLKEMEYHDHVPLCVKSREIDIALRQFPEESVARAHAGKLKAEWHALRDAGAPEPDVWNAELRFLGAEDTLSMLLLFKQGRLAALTDNQPMEVQIVGLGDVRMVGLPGEIFVEYGLAIQYRAPFAKTFVVELANGTLPGYAATARAYAEGGYETGASMLTGQSGDQLVDAAVALLCETSV